MDQEERRKFFGSMAFPAILLIVIWLVKTLEVAFGISLSEYGLQPQTFKGLRGILFSPLLHGDWAHLWSNSVPLFLLSSGLFYYYGRKAWTLFALSWLITGIWVWAFASDEGVHIGASGVVYALATFHFTSGLLRREPRMMAFSLLVVFLYGGLVWGISPQFFPGKNISWESHLLGGLAGILLALVYRTDGPQRPKYSWETEEEEDEDEPAEDTPDSILPENDADPGQQEHPQGDQERIRLNYEYRENKDRPV
jgi:membrane associated rhomboid family serine protease